MNAAHTNTRLPVILYHIECVTVSFLKTWEHKQEVITSTPTYKTTVLYFIMLKPFDLMWNVKLKFSRELNLSLLPVFLPKGGCDQHTVWIWHSSERCKYTFFRRIFTQKLIQPLFTLMSLQSVWLSFFCGMHSFPYNWSDWELGCQASKWLKIPIKVS